MTFMKLSVWLWLPGIPQKLRLAHFDQMFFRSPLSQSYPVFVFLVVSIHVSGMSIPMSNLCCNRQSLMWMASFTLRLIVIGSLSIYSTSVQSRWFPGVFWNCRGLCLSMPFLDMPCYSFNLTCIGLAKKCQFFSVFTCVYGVVMIIISVIASGVLIMITN